MSKKILLTCLVVVVFAFTSAQSPPRHVSQIREAEAIDSGAGPFSDLTLEISVPHATLWSLQPIPINIVESNRTNQPILGYSAITLEGSPLSIYLRKVGSSQRVSIQTSTALIYKVSTNVTIASGKVVESKEWLAVGLGKYFPEPGTYELQAVLASADRTQFLESNIVTIEIREPTGSARAAFNLIRSSGHKDYLFSGFNFESTRSLLEALKTQYLNTPYGQGATFVLGEAHFENREYSTALANLVLLENSRDFIFAEKVRNYLAKIRALQASGPQ